MAKPARKPKPKTKAKAKATKKPDGPKIKNNFVSRRHHAASLGKRPPVEGAELILPKAKAGRPSLYKPEIYWPILERISAGESLIRICAEEGQPDANTVNGWVTRYPEFKEKYKEALALRTHHWAEQLVEIADTPEIMEKVITKTGGKEGDTEQVISGDAVEHRKLRIETRLKMMARHNRAEYGEKVETSGTMEHNHTIKVIRMHAVKPKPWIEHEG